MNYKERIKVLIVWVLIFFVFGEIAIRVFDSFTQENLHAVTSIPDKELGWRAKEHFSIKRELDGRSLVEYSTQQFGFKIYDSSPEKRSRVLIVGDSFTQGVEVSNQDCFYELVQDSLDALIFAYGMAGFGTLQEKMIIDKYREEIKPDLVVLQFCTNDFIDNHYDLNTKCEYKINSRRPYQNLQGSIAYHNPYSRITRVLIKSRFINFVHRKLNSIAVKIGRAENGELQIANQGEQFQAYAESIQITSTLLRQIKNSFSDNTAFILFCADDYEPQLSSIRKICEQEGIHYFEDHIHRLRESVSKNNNPYAADGVHWNQLGHKIVASSIVKTIKEKLANGVLR